MARFERKIRFRAATTRRARRAKAQEVWPRDRLTWPHATNLYAALSEVVTAKAHSGDRTQETKATETIDNDVAVLDALFAAPLALLSQLATSRAGVDTGRTIVTASMETIDPDREVKRDAADFTAILTSV
jgi:hypothetical protein